jgi:hypothetical protein
VLILMEVLSYKKRNITCQYLAFWKQHARYCWSQHRTTGSYRRVTIIHVHHHTPPYTTIHNIHDGLLVSNDDAGVGTAGASGHLLLTCGVQIVTTHPGPGPIFALALHCALQDRIVH